MNLITAVTQFFRPAPAVVMQDDHAFLLNDPTIVEIRQLTDTQILVLDPSNPFFQHLDRRVHVNMAQARAVFNNPPADVTVVIAPAGTFPLPEDAQQYHHAPRVLRDIPAKHVAQRVELTANHHSHDIAFHVQRGDEVVRPTFDEEAPRIKVGEDDDHLASNTGAGSPRSQLMYQLNLIRDAVASAQNQNRDVGYELDPKIIELYEDSFSAFVHETMSNTVTLICQLYNEDRNGLFETVENLGYTLWTPDKGKNLYLKILTRTAKIHL